MGLLLSDASQFCDGVLQSRSSRLSMPVENRYSHLECLANEEFTYSHLRFVFRKAMVRGVFRKLRQEDRALYKCALWVAKKRGRLRSMKLIRQVASIVIRLLSTFRAQVIAAGRARANRLIACLTANGFSKWAPEVFGWLNNKQFILYLGVLEANA
jgi:hypothetical protein